MMNRNILGFWMLASCAFIGLTQEVAETEILGVFVPAEQEALRNRLLLSKSHEKYPVTPGDTYELTYRSAGREYSLEVIIESDYTLNLRIFGEVNASGLFFPELKAKVKDIISSAYPNSAPFLKIQSVGLFQVLIKGEVRSTQFANAWGLSRLSEIVEGKLLEHSSLRRIGIISKDSILREYDIFKAFRWGFIEEDPFVKPGDTIIIYRRGKKIELKGEVFRPGKYQILDSENLEDIIDQYGDGFAELADISRIKVDRLMGESPKTFFTDLRSHKTEIFQLQDGDIVTVQSKLKKLPVVYIEGAIITSNEDTDTAVDETDMEYNRMILPFRTGETLYDVLFPARASISPFADMENAYLIRESKLEPILLNLEKLIYSYRPELDVILKPLDKIVIPSLRLFITVMGAVDRPGNYRYLPNKKHPYYVGIAGGIPQDINSDNVTILTKHGSQRGKDADVHPEDTIIVAQSFVSVTGAVFNPGRYPYTPGKTHSYYVDMAGGIDPERNADETAVRITDSAGIVCKRDDIIRPNDRIFVEFNSFIYSFNRYFPVITTGISFIITIIAIIDLLSD